MDQVYNHLPLFTIHNLAMISDWLDESGELYIDVSFNYNYDSLSYFIRSIKDLRLLVMEQSRQPEISFSIYRDTLFPLRGVADKDFLERVLQTFSEGEEFYVVASTYYPDEIQGFTVDSSQLTLIHLFGENWGHPITVGSTQRGQTLDEDDIVRVRSFNRRLPDDLCVYPPYDVDPARYQWIVEMWRE